MFEKGKNKPHPLPSFANMSRRVKLGQHSNSPHKAKLDNLLDILFGVNLVWCVSSVLGHLGPGAAHVGEAVRVGDVPVESVHLRHGHGLDRAQDGRLVHEVARRVEEDTTVGERRTILDEDVARDFKLAVQIVVGDQLGEGLDTVTHAEVAVAGYVGRELREKIKIFDNLSSEKQVLLQHFLREFLGTIIY